jgi:hypothetical protein
LLADSLVSSYLYQKHRENNTIPAAVVNVNGPTAETVSGNVNGTNLFVGPLSPDGLNANPSNLQSPFAGLLISSPSGMGSASGTVTLSYFQFVDKAGTPPIQ